MIVYHLFHNINVDTSQILHECFPHQGQGSYYVVQLSDHRVHVYNQWWQWRKFSFRGGGGGGGGQSSRISDNITSLGQHIEDAIQHATR